MATIPRLPKKPEPPKPSPVRTYTIEEMTMFGWIHHGPPIGKGANRTFSRPSHSERARPATSSKGRNTMKAPTLHSFLEECCAAKTSDEIGLVVNQIEERIGTMRADRSKFDGQLQEAIVAGRDPGKIHTAIAQLDQDLMTLEAARAGFSQKQTDVRNVESAREIEVVVDRRAQESGAVEAATRDFAAIMEKARTAGALVASLAKQHDRTAVELESQKQRPAKLASGIIRDTIGEVRRGDGVSEYGQRVDIALAEVLSMNPGHLMRSRDSRRQRGRFGESSAHNDHAVEALMTQARAN